MQILNYYNYFYKVATTGNITQAARELFISQPALSKAIANLEAQIGCPLFNRSRKGVSLTPAGELLFQNVKQTYALYNKTQAKINAIRQAPISEVKIGIGADLCEQFLLPCMSGFYARNPSTLIRVCIMSTDDMSYSLSQNQIDIAISTESLGNGFVFSHKLFPLYDCFIAGPRYRFLCEGDPMSIYEIIDYPLIMLNKNSRTRISFENVLSSYGITIPPVHEIADTQLISKFVQMGYGIGCVTENFILDDLKAERVFKIPITEYLPPRFATLTCNNDIIASTVAQLLLNHLKDPVVQE